jgi:large subunit ribosomal protein L29
MANEAYELLVAKTGEELQQDLLEAKTRLQKLRFANAISPIEQPKQLGLIRKEIARIKTELRKRQLSQ